MRIKQWIVFLFLTGALGTATAMAADNMAENVQGNSSTPLETISRSSEDGQHKDCPMHQEKKKCEHKSGEPCAHHKGNKQHAHTREQCEHKHPG